MSPKVTSEFLSHKNVQTNPNLLPYISVLAPHMCQHMALCGNGNNKEKHLACYFTADGKFSSV